MFTDNQTFEKDGEWGWVRLGWVGVNDARRPAKVALLMIRTLES